MNPPNAPTHPDRRRALVRGSGAVLIGAAPGLLTACSPAPVSGAGFGSLPAALATLQSLKD